MTRLQYNLIVVVWLAPLVILDFIGNTITTGSESDYFYYKTMLDGLLICYALYQVFGRPETTTRATAQRRQDDKSDAGGMGIRYNKGEDHGHQPSILSAHR